MSISSRVAAGLASKFPQRFLKDTPKILVNSLFLKVDVSKFPDFADEHANVAKAIVIGDARAAKQEMAAHIRRSHRQFTLVLKERS